MQCAREEGAGSSRWGGEAGEPYRLARRNARGDVGGCGRSRGGGAEAIGVFSSPNPRSISGTATAGSSMRRRIKRGKGERRRRGQVAQCCVCVWECAVGRGWVASGGLQLVVGPAERRGPRPRVVAGGPTPMALLLVSAQTTSRRAPFGLSFSWHTPTLWQFGLWLWGRAHAVYVDTLPDLAFTHRSWFDEWVCCSILWYEKSWLKILFADLL